MIFLRLCIIGFFWGPTAIWAQGNCPDGQVLRSRIVVEKPSRLVNMYAMPENVDEEGLVEIEVFENTELITVPAVYEWIPRPPNYQAPKTISWSETMDMSGVRCNSAYERALYQTSDKVTGADQRSVLKSRTFLGESSYKTSCKRVTIDEPVVIQHEIDYDPKEWERGDQIRILKSPAKTIPRETPPITKRKKAEPIFFGRSYRSAELREEKAQCRRPIQPQPQLKRSEISVTSWSVVYFKGFDPDSHMDSTKFKRLTEPYDLSRSVLTTSIDPNTGDLVWNGFQSCNPIFNKAVNPSNNYGLRVWMPVESAVKEACTELWMEVETGITVEKISATHSAEFHFLNIIGPKMAYHLADMESGILIWYNKDGEEIARFRRIHNTQ